MSAADGTGAKRRPLADDLLAKLAARHGTPLWVTSASLVRERLARLRAPGVFDRVRFAQKANPSLALLRLLRGEGAAVDAVSAGEIARALAAGFRAEEVVFCADLFDAPALELCAARPVQLNLGSPHMLEEAARLRPGGAVWLRVNPGFGHGHGPKVATGGEASKHGVWHADVPAVAARAAQLGLRVEGLHVHIGSGADLEHLARAGPALLAAARACASTLRRVSAGGGLPIPYRPGEREFDVAAHAAAWGAVRAELERAVGRALELELEPGRYLVAEAGVLLARVLGVKQSGGTRFALVDAGFHNLLRPALYGAYHHLSLVGDPARPTRPQVVAGPLCESADVLTHEGGSVVARELPELRAGDLLCVHDAGAYGASMSSHYNSQPLAAELLVDGERAVVARPRQTLDDLLAAEREALARADAEAGPQGAG